jgi:vancomycin aglycone glucosyltransferase
VLLSTYGGRGDVEPLVGLAVRLRALGAEVRACAPPDCAERLAEVGVPLVPVGPPVRQLVHGATRPSVADVPRLAAELIAEQFDKLPAAAEGCDALVATGLFPVAASAQSVAEKLGIRYIFAAYCPILLPSPHRPPQALPGRPLPPDVTDNRVLNDLDIQNYNALFGDALNTHRAAIGLPPVDNVRDHVFTDHPWLAADPTLGPWQESPDLDVVQTGAWILRDERAPAPGRAGGVPGRRDTTGVRGLRQHARTEGRRPGGHRGDPRAGPPRTRRPRLGRSRPDRRPGRLLRRRRGQPAATVPPGGRRRAPRRRGHHGGAGTTTTATRAGAPQVVVSQMADQPYWAGRVADLGIGMAHDGPTPTTESLSAALSTALIPETRARATAVAGTIRTDGTTVAATLLLDAISREKPPVPA